MPFANTDRQTDLRRIIDCKHSITPCPIMYCNLSELSRRKNCLTVSPLHCESKQLDIGHPNQVNPHRFQSPKLPQNVRFNQTPRSQNHRSRVPNPSRVSIATTQPLKHVKTFLNEVILLNQTEQISRISVNGND